MFCASAQIMEPKNEERTPKYLGVRENCKQIYIQQKHLYPILADAITRSNDFAIINNGKQRCTGF